MRLLLLVIAALALLPAGGAFAAGNFAFAVPAPNGFSLTVSGYDPSGKELFSVHNDQTEDLGGLSHYIVRVDETIIKTNVLARWCVTDESMKLPAQQRLGVATACIDKPTETRGNYVFDMALAVAAPNAEPPADQGMTGDQLMGAAALCAEQALALLGFDPGTADGIIDGQSKAAGAAYVTKFAPKPQLPELNEGAQLSWCLRLERGHPEVAEIARSVADHASFQIMVMLPPGPTFAVTMQKGEEILARDDEPKRPDGANGTLSSFAYRQIRDMDRFCVIFSGDWRVAGPNGQWFGGSCNPFDATFLSVAGPVLYGLNDVKQVPMSESEAVACVQTELNALGYDAGSVDGQLGRGTRAALAAYLERQTALPDLPALDAASAVQWCKALRDAIATGTAVGAQATSLRFGPDIDGGIRSHVAAAIPQIAAFMRDTTGYELPQPPDVYVSSDAEWLTEAYLLERDFGSRYRAGKLEDFGRCNGGEGGHSFIFMCAKADVFSRDWFGRGLASQRRLGLAHEYFHVIQYELAGERSWQCCSGNESVELLGPQWLVEGAAEYLAFVITRDDGWTGFAQEMDWHKSQSVKSGNLPSELVTREQFYADPLASSVGMVAAQLLLEQAGGAAFVEFWRQMGDGADWPDAFGTAFGRTPEAFDAEFAAYIS